MRLLRTLLMLTATAWCPVSGLVLSLRPALHVLASPRLSSPRLASRAPPSRAWATPTDLPESSPSAATQSDSSSRDLVLFQAYRRTCRFTMGAQALMVFMGTTMLTLANVLRQQTPLPDRLSVWACSSLGYDALSTIVGAVGMAWIWTTTRQATSPPSSQTLAQYCRVATGIHLTGLVLAAAGSLVAAEGLAKALIPDLRTGVQALLASSVSVEARSLLLLLANADALCCHALSLSLLTGLSWRLQ